MSGWIKLHRELKDWEWYQKPNHAFLFMHLLMKANHKAGKWQGVQVEAGQMITGRKVLSAETGIGEQSIRTILNNLKSTNEITIESSTKYSIISIVNWANYQSDNQQTNQGLTNGQPTTNQRPTTNKNEKNEKNEKNNIKSENPTERVDYNFYSNCWNILTKDKLAQVKLLTDSRKRALKILIGKTGSKNFQEDFEAYIKQVLSSDFLCGGNNNNWQASFDWCLNSKNYTKVIEGNYNRTNSKSISSDEDFLNS